MASNSNSCCLNTNAKSKKKNCIVPKNSRQLSNSSWKSDNNRKSDQKKKQRRLRLITLQGTINNTQ